MSSRGLSQARSSIRRCPSGPKRARAAARPRASCFQPRNWLKLATVLLAFALLVARHAEAHSMAVPVGTQADLLAKLAAFDRNFAARAGSKAVILLVTMPGNADSKKAALEMEGALRRLPKVGNLPHEEHIITLSSAKAL